LKSFSIFRVEDIVVFLQRFMSNLVLNKIEQNVVRPINDMIIAKRTAIGFKDFIFVINCE
jgi:hypothetical protein